MAKLHLQEPITVPIPKRLLPGAVIIQGRLMIYDEGCDSYPIGYFGARIRMSAPLAKGETQPQVYVFRGLPAPTKQAAKEKVIQAALHHLCTLHNIVVDNHNYNTLKTMHCMT